MCMLHDNRVHMLVSVSLSAVVGNEDRHVFSLKQISMEDLTQNTELGTCFRC